VKWIEAPTKCTNGGGRHARIKMHSKLFYQSKKRTTPYLKQLILKDSMFIKYSRLASFLETFGKKLFAYSVGNSGYTH
jgi:hypothetical protein